MGHKATPAPAAPVAGPKVTPLDTAATAQRAVRKKRAVLTGTTLLGSDTLGGGF